MPLNFVIYIAKCVAGCAIVFWLSWLLDYPDISWCLISVILVLTPESSEALPLALTRIKANIIGGIASTICILLFSPTPVSIILAIIISIFGCYFFKLMTGSRAAIAAVIIIMEYGLQYDLPDYWSGTLKRMLSVVTGCFIGLIVTLIFHRNFFEKSPPDSNQQYEN